MNLTTKTLDHLADEVVTFVKSALDGPMVRGRIDALEARIAQLESNHAAPTQRH